MRKDFEGKSTDTAQVQGVNVAGTQIGLNNDISIGRVVLISSFSPEEDKAIRRKVD